MEKIVEGQGRPGMLDRVHLDVRKKELLKCIAKVLLLSFLLAVVFEALTLFGAPVASVFDLSAWSKKRIVTVWVLFVVSYCVCRYLGVFDSLCRWARSVYRQKSFLLPRLLFCVGGFVGSGVVGLLGTMLFSLTGAYQPTVALGLFFFAVCGSIFLVFANRRFLAREPEKIFVPVGITLGVLVCLLTPVQTSVSWDDHIHYDFANAVSYLVSPEYSQADMSLLNPPYIGGGDYSHWMYQGDAYGSLISELDAEGLAPAITVDGFGSVYGSSTLSYQALGYIPSALGLWLGRLLHLPFTWIFILGRISNVLFFFTLVFFGVRGLRSQKMLALAFSFLPTVVFLSANYSYDTWLTGWILFGFLRYLSWMQKPDEALTFKEVLLVVLSFLIGLGPKAIYFPIFILLLFIPKSKFKTKKFAFRYRAAMICSALLVMATFLLPFVVQGPGSGDTRGGSGVNSAGQVAFVLSDPLGYLNVLTRFLSEYLSIPNASNYTSFFAYLGMSSWGSLPLVILILVAATDLNEHSFRYAKWRYRVAGSLLLVGTSALMASALYVSYTAVGSNTIEGCQGRYLLPLVIPFLALFFNSKIINENSRKGYNLVIFVVSFALLTTSIFELCMRVYTP
ncbi:DUF2142 domain-containing protein [Eggerthella lenta]|nr:DUF2142 domain-containing protein [Eggerthella lenta]RDB83748.1 hypothetical protein C1870_09145 [Eggerthella lenta]